MSFMRPSQRAAAYLTLSNVGLACLVAAVWSLALGAPTAVVTTLMVLGGVSIAVSTGWTAERSTADRDAVAKLGWSSSRLTAIRWYKAVMVGLFFCGAVALLAR